MERVSYASCGLWVLRSFDRDLTVLIIDLPGFRDPFGRPRTIGIFLQHRNSELHHLGFEVPKTTVEHSWSLRPIPQGIEGDYFKQWA